MNDGRLDSFTRGAKFLTHLEHLQNLFFISRLTVRSSQATDDSRVLAETSFDLLSGTLALWIESQDAAPVPFDWVVTSYACPPAGVLCSELLRPDSFLSYAQTHPGGGQGQTRLRRSGVVQQLSLLSGFLTSVGSNAPNARLWASVKDVICRTLDQTLNMPAAGQAGGRGGGGGGGGGGAGEGEGSSALVADQSQTTAEPWQEMFADVHVPDIFHDVFAFELLDTFDWLPHDQGGRSSPDI